MKNSPGNAITVYDARTACLFGIVVLLFLLVGPRAGAVAPGYVLHFNFLLTPQAAREGVAQAAAAGARIISLVPPAHIWEDEAGLQNLSAALDEAKLRGMRVLITRLDAQQTNGSVWVYAHALIDSACMPDGRAIPGDWFFATVGNQPFADWQREETRYYAQLVGQSSVLDAVAFGGMVEPFVSQRGSLLAWSEEAQTYEIAQYTPEGLLEWHHWLEEHFTSLAAINTEYHAAFTTLSDIPMPRNPTDARFGKAREAYFDFATSLNDWFLTQYRECRRAWQTGSRKPFLLQLSGFETEKIALGRPEFAAFDLPAWLDEADGIGLSLYTQADYTDWGHASDVATLQLLQGARETGKPAYILESGCEAPRVTVEPHELSFALRYGLALHPDAYVYEYFRYKRDNRVDPGMMVTPDGARNEPGYSRVSRLLASVTQFAPAAAPACFTYLSVPRTARSNALAGELNAAVYALAGIVPCRLLPWGCFKRLPRGTLVLLPPDIQRVIPRDQLTAFLTMARDRWWRLASDEVTCDALRQVEKTLSLCPLSLEDLASATSGDDRAEALYTALQTVPTFRWQCAALPVTPRPGICWLQLGTSLYLWSEDTVPIICHPAALARLGITRVWGSTRHNEALPLIMGKGAARHLPCREWRAVRNLQ